MLAVKHVHDKKRRAHPRKYSLTAFDRVVYVISFMGPMMTIPQVYDIWVLRSTSVNLLTWGSYMVFAAIWLSYGVIHKEKPIIYGNTLSFIANGMVFLGAVLLR